jgi:hypothetical protein
MKKSIVILVAMALVLMTNTTAVLAEGTVDLGQNQALLAETELFVDILYPNAEAISWIGTGSVTIFTPADELLGVISSGGTIVPLVSGPHRVELGQRQDSLWDLTVSGAAPGYGRLYSIEWLLDGGGYSPVGSFNDSLYALVPGGGAGFDGVIELKFEGASGFIQAIAGNRTGVDGQGTRSVSNNEGSFSPEIPLYLNPPETAHYEVKQPNVTAFTVTTNGPADYEFSFTTDVEGVFQVIVDRNQDSIFDLSSDDDVTLIGATSVGANLIPWDGMDALGDPMAPGFYDVMVRVTTGQFHLITDDLETVFEGLRMFEVSEARVPSGLAMYWNDAEVQANAVLMPNAELGLESSGFAGIDSGLFINPADANLNARAWGNFFDGGKGNNALLDTYTWLRESSTRFEEIEIVPDKILVDIDIKLGSDPNCINSESRGKIAVAILGSDTFDVTGIDAITIELDDDEDPATPGVIRDRSSYKDVNSDGVLDVVLHFSSRELNNAGLLGDGYTLYITGNLSDGMPIIGSDVIYLAGGPNCFD